MGAGIAKQVKERYPDVYDIYKSLCNNVVPEVLLGTTLMVQINDALEDSNRKYIANFFSQEHIVIYIYNHYSVLSLSYYPTTYIVAYLQGDYL